MSQELFESELPPIRPDAAIEKLKAEMDKAKNNSYVQVVGDFLIGHLQTNPQDGEKILAADKTIIKSLDEMSKAAQKKQVNRMAMFTPQEGFDLVMKYFGIEGAMPAQPVYQEPTRAAAPEQKPSTDFTVSLDDLLGG